ncbi:MAG TPA: acetyl-CoA C-acyltransferase, partial [Thermoanaerobaculia bacterium]|nr:acetyl-CoA C-acyltransferase [Thermoanaerobaculia bacterium]
MGSESEAYVVDAVRTPRGRGKPGRGSLTGLHPQELLAQTLTAVVARSGVPAADVEDVIVGCVTQVGEQGANIARNAVLAAGWPLDVTGVTL